MNGFGRLETDIQLVYDFYHQYAALVAGNN